MQAPGLWLVLSPDLGTHRAYEWRPNTSVEMSLSLFLLPEPAYVNSAAEDAGCMTGDNSTQFLELPLI